MKHMKKVRMIGYAFIFTEGAGSSKRKKTEMI